MPLFGGTPGQFPLVAPRLHPPARVYRVIPGRVWWTRLHWPWRRYLAAVATGTAGVVPPQLVAPGAPGIYVTDRASLRGCESPADFAWRLSLSAQGQRECQLFGCAVIRFDLPQRYACLALPRLPGAAPGFTGAGGRQWLLAGNLDLADTMQVHWVERRMHGSRWYRLPL
jgi:hypothetical protein